MPAVPLVGRREAFSPSLEGKIVLSKDIAAFPVEQYRRMAALLLELQSQRAAKTVMVTSAVPGEGKTLTVTNLAITLAESYKRRVLLVDADLRHPSLHEVFGVPNEGGLCHDLRAAYGASSVLQVTTNLTLLPAGQAGADPMQVLSSDRLRTLVQEAATHYDWVLLDTPPVCLLSDAQVVARVADAVLLVIAARLTPYKLVEYAIGELGADRIVGTVLNRAEEHALPAGNYRSHDYYRGVGSQSVGIPWRPTKAAGRMASLS